MKPYQPIVCSDYSEHNKHTVLTAAWKGLGVCSRSRRHATQKAYRGEVPACVANWAFGGFELPPAIAGLASCPSEAITERRPSNRVSPASGQAVNWGQSFLHRLAPFLFKRHDEPDYSGAV